MAPPPPKPTDPLDPAAAVHAKDAETAKDREAHEAAEKKAAEERQTLSTATEAVDKAAADAPARVREAIVALECEHTAALEAERSAAVARLLVNPPKADRDAGGADPDALFEAATIANLHAQAASVQNIRVLMLVVLDPLSSH